MNTNLDKTNDIYYTSIVLDNEFKELIYKQIKYAQNVFHAHYLPNLTVYSCYHAPLETYFKQKYNKSPTKPDKLAFLLLLTYPVDIVRNFNSVRDIKLNFGSEKSDFQIYGEKIITKDNTNDYENDDFDGGFVNTCICSKRIQNIYIIQNKNNNITVQVGCDCIEKNGLVSPEEIKIHKKKIEMLLEREKERIENKPDGYYEKLRQENKKLKEEEKNKKKADKLVDKLNKLNDKKPGGYLSKKCYACESDSIFKLKPGKTEPEVVLCSRCCPQKYIEKKQVFIKEIKSLIPECVKCETDIICTKNLCLECDKVYIIKKCRLCDDDFIDPHKSNDIYCDVCDKKLIKCIDCKRDILKDSTNNTRCNNCNYNFINKITVKSCEGCGNKLTLKESEKWRTFCNHICRSNSIQLKTCLDCDAPFKATKSETWMIRCKDCHKKNKNVV